MNEILRVSLAFASYPQGKYSVFVRCLVHNVYKVPELSIPIPKAILEGMHAAYTRAESRQASSGPDGTLLKHKCRKELTAALKEIAHYVEHNSSSLEVLLRCGFRAINKKPRSTPLRTPSIKRITFEDSGSARVTVTTRPNVRMHEVCVSEMDEAGRFGPFRPGVVSSSSLKIPIPGLTPGRLCQFKVRSYGRGDTCTDWSSIIAQRAL